MGDQTHTAAHATRQPPGCIHCGYDLTGFTIGETCPECGRRIVDLQQDPELSPFAGSSLLCGVLSLLALFGGWSSGFEGDLLVALPMMFVSVGLSCIGVVLAVLTRRSIKQRPFKFAPGSMTIARVGFWLSAPGLILLLAGIGIELVRHAL